VLQKAWDEWRALSMRAAKSSEVDRLIYLESKVLRAPISSPADAAAKLCVIELAFADGPRSDGLDHVALQMVTEWVLSAGWRHDDEAPSRARRRRRSAGSALAFNEA
jgi:hypothetical protein